MTKLKDYPSGTVEAGVKLAGVNGVGDVQLYDATTFIGPEGPESQVPGPAGATGPALTPNEHAAFNEAKVTAIQTADVDWVIVVDNDTRSNQASPASIAGDMSGHMLKFRTSDNTWLDLGQWRGSTGPEGPMGPAGGGLVPDGYGILNEAKISAVQAADVNYVYVVDPLGDTRSNKNSPAGIVGDMERHIIRYDAATNAWKDFGQFTGIQGPRGPQGLPGPASTVPGPASTVPGPVGPAAWGPVQPWAQGLACSGVAPKTVVTYLGESYVCKSTHTAGSTFNAANFDKIASKGANGLPAATATQGRTGTSDVVVLTPKTLLDMVTPVALSGSPAAWDMNAVINAELVLTANRTVAAPSNAKKGVTYTLAVIQSGSGGYTPTYPTSFDFGPGADITPSTAVGKIDLVTAHCLSTSPLLFRCGFAKAS